MSSRRNDDRRVYIGNLHTDTRRRDIEELFDNYGRIIDVNLVSGDHGRHQRAPFAFVEFEDPRDARDAVERRDGYYFMGRKLRVEFPRGDRDRGGRFGGGGRGGGGDRRDGPRGSVRRTKYRVMVAGLPASASWQDLKDHMRSAGEVAFSDVYKDGSGVVDFIRYDDMRYAVKNLEDSKFRSHEGETSYISVKEDYDDDHRDRSRSPRSRSRSRTPPRASRASKSRSRSRSRSPVASSSRKRVDDSKAKSPSSPRGRSPPSPDKESSRRSRHRR